MKRALVVIVAAMVALVLFHATTANATSNPYTVTADGVRLTEGTFEASGHVNVRYTVDGVESAAGLHLDPNNGQPGGAWIGEPFIPWSALGVPETACIVWVQIHPFNYHFGENGEEPVCLSTTVPTSTPSLPVEPTPTSTPPVEEPEPTSTPTVTPSPSPVPSTTPLPSSTPEETTTPSPSPTSSSPTSSPSPTPSPSTGIGTPAFPEATSTPEPSQTTSPVPSKSEGSSGTRSTLPVTGSVEPWRLLVVVAFLVGMGGLALWAERRKPRS